MVQLSKDEKEAIEKWTHRWMTKNDLPGASVAILRDGELVHATGIGSRDLLSNQPATPDTVYCIGSCTKSFTAAGILQLQEDGHLDVHDPVSEHIDFDLGYGKEPIKIHHLLTHTSGIPNLGVAKTFLTRALDTGGHKPPLGDWDDFDAHWQGAASEISSRPGERFMYCNEGYTLLGRIIEEHSGQSFASYIQDNILEPLDMTRSTFSREEWDEMSDTTTSYLLEDGEPIPKQMPFRRLAQPQGGLNSSVIDMANYVSMYMNNGEFNGKEILSPESIAKMEEPAVKNHSRHYGYGWMRRDVLDRTLIGHNGGIRVNQSFAGYTEDGKFGFVIHCNAKPATLPDLVAHAYLTELSGLDPETELAFYKRQRLFEKLIGKYENYRGIATATVESRTEPLDQSLGETLELKVDASDDLANRKGRILIPTYETVEKNGSTVHKFLSPRINDTRDQFEFEVSDDGSVTLYTDYFQFSKVD